MRKWIIVICFCATTVLANDKIEISSTEFVPMLEGITVNAMQTDRMLQPKSQLQSQQEDLQVPLISDEELLRWAKSAALAPYNYNYQAYPEQLAAAAHFFTPKAWQEFRSNLLRFGDEASFVKRQARLSASATGKASITKQGVLHGHYAWQVTLPLRVVYQDLYKSRRHEILAILLIRRDAVANNPSGLVLWYYQPTVRSVM